MLKERVTHADGERASNLKVAHDNVRLREAIPVIEEVFGAEAQIPLACLLPEVVCVQGRYNTLYTVAPS